MHTVASARHRPSSAPHARTPAPFGSRLYGGVLALVAVAALAGWFMLYPLDRVMAGALLAGYGLLVVLRPASWLIIVPAVWPVVDLAPWSGHFHVTESDALILTTLAALGLREAFAPPPATLKGRAPVKLTLAALALFGLLAASVVISGLRGLYPLPPLDAAALVSYSSGLNALRVGKGFVLAFALIPFLHLAIRRDGDAALERLTRGMMLGLGTCALAALWERLAFPGLTDFANDYRTTALFWEMHVGGAALDAWLMLCFPFAVLALSQARSAPGKALALLVLGIGSYALFTTFSRIVYAALVISLSLLGALALARPASTATPRRPGVLVALIAIALLGCGLSFPEGGYRALLAFVGTLLLAYLGGGAVAVVVPVALATSGALDAFGGATSNTVSAAAPPPPATSPRNLIAGPKPTRAVPSAVADTCATSASASTVATAVLDAPSGIVVALAKSSVVPMAEMFFSFARSPDAPTIR